MYVLQCIENFCALDVCCFGDPRTFFSSELLSIYGITVWYFYDHLDKLPITYTLSLYRMFDQMKWQYGY